MNRTQAIETARAVLTNGPTSHADAVALAIYVLEVNQEFENVVSPSTSSYGGGESPATPESAPDSEKATRSPSARNLRGPSGPELGFPVTEPDTAVDGAKPTNAATVPTVYPTAGMAWQDEQIARWLESHANGYTHSGDVEVGRVLRKKAAKIRRREYLEP